MDSKELYLLIRGWEYVEKDSFLEVFNPLIDVHDLAKWLNQNKSYPNLKYKRFIEYNKNEPMVGLADLLVGESHPYTLFMYTVDKDITAYLKALTLLSEYLSAKYDSYKEVLDSFFLDEYADCTKERELYTNSTELENEWRRILSLTMESVMNATSTLYEASCYQKEHNNYYDDVYQENSGSREYEITMIESFILPPSSASKKPGIIYPTYYFCIHYNVNGKIEIIMVNTRELADKIKISPYKSKIIFKENGSKIVELRLNRKYSRLFTK